MDRNLSFVQLVIPVKDRRELERDRDRDREVRSDLREDGGEGIK